MGIKPNFNRGDISKALNNHMKKVEDAIVKRLKKLGEECVIQAATRGNYQDHSGNLRASIGYAVTIGKEIVHVGVEGTAEGSEKAKETIKNALATNSDQNSITLIVVAGMDYAEYVEAKKFDVLTATEEWTKGRAEQLIHNLFANENRI